MKKLIAKKPIQYGGRIYTPGETVPAHDQRMVKAWLSASTAEWKDTAAKPDTTTQATGMENEGWKAINALLDMGLVLEDENGAFVGAENLAEQLRAAFAPQEPAGGDKPDGGGTDTQDNENDAQGAPEAPTEGDNEQGGQETVTGHLDAADLEKMSREKLNEMAIEMGLDITECKNKGDVARMIAAVPVQVPASENNEGAQ